MRVTPNKCGATAGGQMSGFRSIDIATVNALLNDDCHAIRAYVPALKSEDFSRPHAGKYGKVVNDALAQIEHANVLFCLLSCHGPCNSDGRFLRGVKGCRQVIAGRGTRRGSHHRFALISGSSADGSQPTKQEKVAPAKRTTVG
jgi:hypothetical protein